MRAHWLLPLMVLAACGDKGGDAGSGDEGGTDGGGDEGGGDEGGGDEGGGDEGGGDEPQDRDGDGYTDDVDCDDGDASIHPDAVETCNGVDDDCDLSVDEGEPEDGPSWYADADGDGFGDPDNAVRACTRPDGWTGDATDCDDGDETIHPDAAETCNGVDDDCDGAVDADDPDAAGGAVWYADTDGDGYGDPASSVASCTQPSGHVADATDCDDGDASVSPSGTETCNGVDDDCDGDLDDADADLVGGVSAWTDADGDGWGDDGAAAITVCSVGAGYAGQAGDCDDSDAAISPDASEVCDGAVDEDCDGLVDDADSVVSGGATFYVDADGDGYGGSTTTEACSQPSGTTTTADDCDDADASVNPGATETCNSVDDDCDGDIDDADSTVTGTSTWYADVDGDGYGASTISTAACAAPSGFVATSTDCDDTDAAVSPAGTETCNGVDDDCDGLTDDDDTVVDVSSLSGFYVDGDGDGYGVATSTTTACDAPTGYAEVSGDCDDSDGGVSPSATETCNGTDDDCDGDTDADDSDLVGGTVYYSDADGDGYGATGSGTLSCSVVSGSVTTSGDCDDVDSSVNPGEAEVCEDGIDNDCAGGDATCTSSGGGGSGTTGLYDADAESFAVVYGEVRYEQLGDALAAAGDVNGDGIDDLLIGNESLYRAMVYFGPLSGSLVSGDHDWVVTASSYSDDLGFSATTAGDVDGDGQDDLMAGAPYRTCGGYSGAGSVLLFHGPLTAGGSVADSDADVTLCGDRDYAAVGILHRNVGDVDGDGEDDLLIGGWRGQRRTTTSSNYFGAAFLFHGPVTADTTIAAADAYYDGTGSYAYVGRRNTFGSGDIDGDGLNDLVVGEYGESNAYVLYGPASASGALDSVADVALEGFSGSYAGFSAGIAGDMDGDGHDDVAVSAYLYDASATETDAGRTYIWHGPISAGTTNIELADVRLLGTTKQDYQGVSLDGPGDLDGDGLDDLLVGAYGDDELYSLAGATYLVWGGVSGTSDLDSASAVKFGGPAASLELGWAAAGVGDVDDDGQIDIGLGAPGYTLRGTTTVSGVGAVYLIPGSGW